MMTTAFVLHHTYETDGCNETKFIGVYSTREKAEEAISRLKIQKGFIDRPDDFQIADYELDKDHWTEGYAVMTTIQVKDKNNNWMTVQAEALADGNYQIVELYEADALGEFKHLDVVECKERDGGFYAVKRISQNKL